MVSTSDCRSEGGSSILPTPHYDILTIGYGGKHPTEFGFELGKLMPCCVVDVRRDPHHAFLNSYTKKALEKTIDMWNDCEYVWIPELGNKIKTLPPVLIDEEKGITKLRALASKHKRIVLLCAEKDEKRCHRLYVKMAFLYGELREKIAKCWTTETSYYGEKTTDSSCKSIGQCYVTALLVRDLLGGDILTATIDPIKWSLLSQETHFWNRLPDGTELDLTSDQYDGDGFNPIIEGTKARRINRTNKRYLLLKRLYMWRFKW